MENDESMRGGVGASAVFVGSATAGDTVDQMFAGPRVVALAGSFGTQAGLLELVHPQGTKQWSLLPTGSPSYRLEGPGGRYGATLHRVGAYFEAFWFAMAEFHPIKSAEDILALPIADA